MEIAPYIAMTVLQLEYIPGEPMKRFALILAMLTLLCGGGVYAQDQSLSSMKNVVGKHVYNLGGL